jgi:polysaccharide export outer membrane protein
MPRLFRINLSIMARLAAVAWLGLMIFSPQVSAADDTNYRLRAMDLLKVQVFDQPSLDREVRVNKDLTIVLPLIGKVDVQNRTGRDLERLVTQLYKADYLVNPQINITIVEYAPNSVNVFGAVNNPASVPIPPEKNFSLLDAIAKAGGFSRLANRNRISLTRIGPNGQAQNYLINADELMTGDTTNRWPLRDGDVITVAERMF